MGIVFIRNTLNVIHEIFISSVFYQIKRRLETCPLKCYFLHPSKCRFISVVFFYIIYIVTFVFCSNEWVYTVHCIVYTVMSTLYNCTTIQLYNCTTAQLYNCTTCESITFYAEIVFYIVLTVEFIDNSINKLGGTTHSSICWTFVSEL